MSKVYFQGGWNVELHVFLGISTALFLFVCESVWAEFSIFFFSWTFLLHFIIQEKWKCQYFSNCGGFHIYGPLSNTSPWYGTVRSQARQISAKGFSLKGITLIFRKYIAIAVIGHSKHKNMSWSLAVPHQIFLKCVIFLVFIKGWVMPLAESSEARPPEMLCPIVLSVCVTHWHNKHCHLLAVSLWCLLLLKLTSPPPSLFHLHHMKGEQNEMFALF